MIQIGDKIPNLVLRLKLDKIEEKLSHEIFANQKVVLFGLPGAFTPTCSAKHLPGYISFLEQILNKGIDKVSCFSVNDPHVMKAWAEHNTIHNIIEMISDSDCSFTKEMGLVHDYGPAMGLRCRRFAMVLNNCIVEHLFVEKIGVFEVSSAQNVLKHL